MLRGRTGYTTASKLLATAREVKANPAITLSTGIWTDPTWTTRDFWHWFYDCLADKINRDDPRANWRKMQDEYQTGQAVDARLVNAYHGSRVRQTGCRNILRTPELARRYPYVHTQPAGW